MSFICPSLVQNPEFKVHALRATADDYCLLERDVI